MFYILGTIGIFNFENVLPHGRPFDNTDNCTRAIDRIYGTAATLGFKEIAEYARTIKTVCYKTAQSKNIYAYGMVKDLLWVCTQNLKRLEASVRDIKVMRQLRIPFTDERIKAESLMKNLLNKIRRSSV